MEQYNKELDSDVDPPRLNAALFRRESDIEGAMLELEALAEKGSSFACGVLGSIYLLGSYGITRDEPRGEKLLSRSASMGSIEGAYRLACYYDSKGRHAEAFELYKSIGERGFSPALYRLGWAYHLGRGVEQNEVTARNLFYRAYKEGHLLAQQKLSYDLRHSRKLSEKLYGHFLLMKLRIPRVLQLIRQPLSDRLRG